MGGPFGDADVFLPKGVIVHFAYNDRPYHERGWCCFEGGVAQVVAAHLAHQASNGHLPPAQTEAEEHRAKLIVIGDDGVGEAHVPDLAPSELLVALQERLRSAFFTSEGDRNTVFRLLREFTWMISRGVEQAAAQQAAEEDQTGCWSAAAVESPSC